MVDESVAVPGNGGSQGKSGIPTIKSFCEVGKVATIFRAFDDKKKELVRSVGFHGLLNIPLIDLLDDKFSMWLMSCLDPKKMMLCLPNGENMAIKDVDAHFVLGLPFRGKLVSHNNRQDKDLVDEVTGKLSIGGHKASLTLEYLEWVLVKEYGQKFQPEEEEAFKTAVVLYSMGSFLAVIGPKLAFPIWLFGNLVATSAIHEYNWSGYILSVLAHGAIQLQSQLNNGSDLVNLYGCTFLLQIMYLDNMDFGPSSAVHMEIPRATVYNSLYMDHLIAMDSHQDAGCDVVEYGRHKLRLGVEVCYTRGWGRPSIDKWAEYDTSYVTTSEIFHNIILYDEKLAAMLAGSLCKIGAVVSADIRNAYKGTYPDYFSTMPAGSLPLSVGNLGEGVGYCEKSKSSGSAPKKAKTILLPQTEANSGSAKGMLGIKGGGCQPSALELLADEATKMHDIEISLSNSDGLHKKLVTEHSKFPKSPFQLGRFMPTISWRKKTALYDWLQPGAEDWGHLTRVWIQLDYPTPISLMGYDLKLQLGTNGYMTSAMVDAITMANIYFDETAYGETGSRWRHFLPASFAEAVLREEDFLTSDKIRAHFTGEHIKYPVENCRLIMAPVLYQGRWSCYVWDFEKKSTTVLDPTRMNTTVGNVEMHHSDLVAKLTSALFACIGRFYLGWEVDTTRWRDLYPIHHGPRSKICTSGLYCILYSRFFDGKHLVCAPNQGGLVEPRSAVLYELLTIRGNKAELPPRIKDIVTRPWLMKRQ